MEELESVGVIDQVEQFDTDLSVLNNESDGTMFASVISERDSLKSENETLKEKMKGMVEMKLAYQNYIPAPPLSQTQ